MGNINNDIKFFKIKVHFMHLNHMYKNSNAIYNCVQIDCSYTMAWILDSFLSAASGIFQSFTLIQTRDELSTLSEKYTQQSVIVSD